MGALPGETGVEEEEEERTGTKPVFGVSAEMGYGDSGDVEGAVLGAPVAREDVENELTRLREPNLAPIPEDRPFSQQQSVSNTAAATYSVSKPTSSIRRAEEAKLRKLFEDADLDGSGTLQLKEVKALCKRMGDRISQLAIEEGFYRMDPERTGKVNFDSFRKWWRLKEDTARRDLRKEVEQVFRMTDVDGSGKLDREEIGLMAVKIAKRFAGASFDPPFDLDTDFAAMDCDNKGYATYEDFAAWFRFRTGDDEPDIPVLPEYMVRKVGALSTQIQHEEAIKESFRERKRGNDKSATNENGLDSLLRSSGPTTRRTRSGKELWGFLAPRLNVLVALQNQWGRVSDLYGTGGPMFESNAIPEGMFDPDSNFAKWWDVAQFVALLYIVFAIPLRIGFAEEVPLLSAAFIIDLIIDVYFIIDIYINFNTAIWLESGELETNIRVVRKRYLKGWFALDFLSSFPLTYFLLIGRLIAGDTRGEKNGYQRLLRLAKVARLSRFKRVIKKYEDSGAIGDVTPYLGTIATVFIVMLLGHLLTCTWYYAGMRYGSIVCDPKESHLYADLLERISGHGLTPIECLPMEDADDGFEFKVPGWVIRQNYPNATTLGTKYIDSVYMVFLRPEIAFTGSELKIGLLSELVLALIFGSLAGVMSSIMIVMGSGQQDAMVKLLAIRAWMRARDLKTSDKAKILAVFNQQAESSTFDQQSILRDLPPSLATDIAYFMYGKYIERMPLFRGLGTEVIAETCKCVTDLKMSRDQVVYQEGRFGTEMYIIVSGEVEVSRDGDRLGFLSQGAFFGETPFIESISGRGGDGSGMRTRTIRTVRACDFGVIQQRDLRDVVETYPELQIRLKNFKLVGTTFGTKGKRMQEYREIKERVTRDAGGGRDGESRELAKPSSGDDIVDKQSARTDGSVQLLPTDDVLNDPALRGIEPQMEAAVPPLCEQRPTASDSSTAAIEAMQTQINTLESEVRAQLELVREEMAETRKQLLAAIGVFTQSHSSENREDTTSAAAARPRRRPSLE